MNETQIDIRKSAETLLNQFNELKNEDYENYIEDILMIRESLLPFFDTVFKQACEMAANGKGFKHYEYKSTGHRRVLREYAEKLLESLPDSEQYFQTIRKVKTIPELTKLLSSEKINAFFEEKSFPPTLVRKSNLVI